MYLSEVGVGEGVLRRRKMRLGFVEGEVRDEEEGEGEDVMVEGRRSCCQSYGI